MRVPGWLVPALVLVLVGPAAAPTTDPGRDPAGETAGADDLPGLAAELLVRVRAYRASLEPVLALRESEAGRLAGLVERQDALLRDGILSRREVEQGRAQLEQAQAAVDQTRGAIVEADQMLGEALARQRLAELPPPPVGGSVAVGSVVLYHGPTPWSLADTPKVARFFEDRFHRALPISAFGQTATHEQLGFDHHAALDVAVHPDSVEGRALTEYLRAAGIPYLAFREALPGTATGAHIHVGPPSSRLARVR